MESPTGGCFQRRLRAVAGDDESGVPPAVSSVMGEATSAGVCGQQNTGDEGDGEESAGGEGGQDTGGQQAQEGPLLVGRHRSAAVIGAARARHR